MTLQDALDYVMARRRLATIRETVRDFVDNLDERIVFDSTVCKEIAAAFPASKEPFSQIRDELQRIADGQFGATRRARDGDESVLFRKRGGRVCPDEIWLRNGGSELDSTRGGVYIKTRPGDPDVHWHDERRGVALTKAAREKVDRFAAADQARYTSLGRSRRYELLAIASGKKSVDEMRAAKAARQAKHLAGLKAAAAQAATPRPLLDVLEETNPSPAWNEPQHGSHIDSLPQELPPSEDLETLKKSLRTQFDRADQEANTEFGTGKDDPFRKSGHRRSRWATWETEFIRINANRVGVPDLSKILHRSQGAVRQKAFEQGRSLDSRKAGVLTEADANKAREYLLKNPTLLRINEKWYSKFGSSKEQDAVLETHLAALSVLTNKVSVKATPVEKKSSRVVRPYSPRVIERKTTRAKAEAAVWKLLTRSRS